MKFLLPLVLVVSISMGMGFQNAEAMTLIFEDEPPTGSDLVCGFGSVWCADDFVLDSLHSVTDAHFWVLEPTGGSGFDGIVNFAIYNDNGGEPGTIVAGGSGVGINVQTMPFDDPDSACTFSANNCIEVWMDLDPSVTLGPGKYWLGIQQSEDWWIRFGGPEELSLAQKSADGISGWFPGGEFALSVTGVVGGILLPPDQTALLLAGVQSNFSILTALVAASSGAIGVLYYSAKTKWKR